MRLVRVAAAVPLLGAVALLSSGGLTGQDKDKKGPESAKAAKGQLPAGWQKLDLTDAQKEEVLKLNAEYKAKTDKLQDEISRLRAEVARKRVAVLNDEQRKKLVDLVATDSLKEKPAEKGKDGPPEREKPKGKVPDKH
jgi:flagellar basal body-associated protein FliL